MLPRLQTESGPCIYQMAAQRSCYSTGSYKSSFHDQSPFSVHRGGKIKLMSAIATHISVEPGSEAFPLLTPAQIERLRPHGKVRHVEAGEVLFEPGDSNVPVYVVLSGGLDIIQPCPQGVRSLVRHVPGSITGEFAVISGQRALLRGEVIASGEFLQIASGEFRALVAKDAELGDILMKAYILRRMLLISEEASNVLVLGSLNCSNTLRLREFLGRNGYPYKFIDLDTDERSQSILDHFQVKVDEVPVVICNGRSVLRNPSIRELADCLGLNVNIDESQVRDLIVVGAGPSGLAAAVYAASEGLNVLVVETGSPGGQAGSSSRIENYLGFPMGISGQELTGRALTQAQKFGANMMIARTAVRLQCDRRPYQVILRRARHCRRAPSCWPPAPNTTSHLFPSYRSSRATASTTVPPLWNRSCAWARTWWSSEEEILRDRRRC